jgi:hypothetical protein
MNRFVTLSMADFDWGIDHSGKQAVHFAIL